jgi:co-chaperonin GroES (HSP10)
MLIAQGKQVVVKPIKTENKVDNIIQIVKTENDTIELCEVISVGKKALEEVDLKEGDKIYIQLNTADKIYDGENEFWTLHFDGIKCKIE